MNGLTTIKLCPYCFKPKHGTGWHDCQQAQEAKCRLDATIAGIKANNADPHMRVPLTEADVKRRDKMQSHVSGVENIFKSRPARPENHSNGNE